MLATKFGIQAVGFYLTAASIITFLALWGIGRHVRDPKAASLMSQEQPG
jgi:hypothetical protein